MKKLCMTLMTLLVVSTMLLIGCGVNVGDDLYIDHAFVGTWHSPYNVQFTHVFEADGTGQMGDAQIRSFTWGTRNGKVVLNFGPPYVIEELVYTFDGNMLSLVGERVSLNYFRLVPDQNLIGNWVILDDYMVGKTVNADGTGYLIYFLGEPGDEMTFNWFSSDGLLIHQFGPLQQDMWTYTLSGDVLNLTNKQITGYTQEFRRGSFEQNPMLLGKWALDYDEEWIIYFGQNSTGKVGWVGEEDPMFWTVFDDTLFFLFDDGFFYENWLFSVTSNTFELINPDDPTERLLHIRLR